MLFSHHKLNIAPVWPPNKLGPVTLATDPLGLVVLDGALLVLPRAVPQAEEPLLLCPAGHPHGPALHHQDRLCLVPHHHRPQSTQLPAGQQACQDQQDHQAHPCQGSHTAPVQDVWQTGWM